MQYTGLGLHLKVRDIAVSRAFYEGVLGLSPTRGSGSDVFRATLPPALPAHPADGLPGAPDAWNSVTYQPAPAAPLEIADGHPAVHDANIYATPIVSPKVSAMLHAASLVPLVRDGGVVPDFPLRAYPWGTVELVLKDPDGFVVVVIAPATDVELAALRAWLPVETIPATRPQ